MAPVAKEPAGPIRQQLDFLLNGFSFYADRDRSRADDLLVREHSAGVLSEAAASLRDLASAYSRRYLPPPTRGTGLPPREAMVGARVIEDLRGRINDAATRLRSQPFPASDRTWARLRSEQAALDLALAFDRRLIADAESVRSEAASLTLEAVAPGMAADTALSALDLAVRSVLSTLAERAHHLDAPL